MTAWDEPFLLGPREGAAVLLASLIIGLIAWFRWRGIPAWRGLDAPAPDPRGGPSGSTGDEDRWAG